MEAKDPRARRRSSRGRWRGLLGFALVAALVACAAPPQGQRRPMPARDADPFPPVAFRLHADGRVSGLVIAGPVREVDAILRVEGPTREEHLERAWRRLDSFGDGLDRLSEHLELDDEEWRAFDRVRDVVSETKLLVAERLVHWNEESTLAALGARWRAVTEKHFAVDLPAIDRGDDDHRDERDPPESSDLREVVSDLFAIASDARSASEWTDEWAADVRRTIKTRRPRPGRSPRARLPVEAYGTTHPAPSDLNRARREIDGARALLSDELGLSFWVEAERSRRIADAVADSATRAEQALREFLADD